MDFKQTLNPPRPESKPLLEGLIASGYLIPVGGSRLPDLLWPTQVGSASSDTPNKAETKSQQLLRRLQDLGSNKVAKRIFACLDEQVHRCKHVLCPRCAAWLARKNRRKLEGVIANLPRELCVGLLTLTVVSSNIREGRQLLVNKFAKLRDQKGWKGILGGMGGMEFLPIAGGGWNIHTHCLILGNVQVQELRKGWKTLLGYVGYVGSLDYFVCPVKFVRDLSQRSGVFSPLAYYTTKRIRSELLGMSDVELEDVVRYVPKERWTMRFGKLSNRHDTS